MLPFLLGSAIVAVGSSSSSRSGMELCRSFTSCVECTEGSYKCAWEAKEKRGSNSSSDESGGVCNLRTTLHGQSPDVYVFDDTCPVDYSTPPPTEGFLSNWMGNVMDIVGHKSLLDLSLPGTHDTLTFDLSLTVSDGGIDEYYELAELLHNYTTVVPDIIEDFMRIGAQTQDLTITQQLDAGIRFLDVRMMLEYTDTPPVWYSLHMLQSTGTSVQYFRDIRTWMDAHPTEIVIMWISKHGNECGTGNDQYPNVSIEQKQAMWAEILAIFNGLAVDFSETKLNETSITTMVERNHRAVFYMADYLELTGYDTIATSTGPYYALDSCLIDNQLGNPDGTDAVQWQRDIYATADARKKTDKAGQRLFLLSLAGGLDYVDATLLKFGALDKIPADDAEIIARCAATFNIPGMNWCPETLLDGSQLANYYSQVAMDEIIEHMMVGSSTYGLPHAIYINAIGSIQGTIRTGTEVLWGKNRSPDDTFAKQGFSYVDSFVLYNVLNICNDKNQRTNGTDGCQSTIDLLVKRRSANPMTLWDDATYGRLTKW